MMHVSEAADGRGHAETHAQQGFSVERVTGIEPALPTWKIGQLESLTCNDANYAAQLCPAR
jgi:hypothetical protein